MVGQHNLLNNNYVRAGLVRFKFFIQNFANGYRLFHLSIYSYRKAPNYKNINTQP